MILSSGENIIASDKPIVRTIIKSNKTYLGALDVIEKILLGSKYLNIKMKYQFSNFYYEMVV